MAVATIRIHVIMPQPWHICCRSVGRTAAQRRDLADSTLKSVLSFGLAEGLTNSTMDMVRDGSNTVVEPKFGPKLLELYRLQEQSSVAEAYNISHLAHYIEYATLQPVPGELLRKGRHRQDAGHDDCTSCHFCRQCTEDRKPKCVNCGKCFCAPCLSNRFGQNVTEMMSLATWVCPVCLDFCNCSGATCRRARLGLEPTASLIHEAQAYGYSSV